MSEPHLPRFARCRRARRSRCRVARRGGRRHGAARVGQDDARAGGGARRFAGRAEGDSRCSRGGWRPGPSRGGSPSCAAARVGDEVGYQVRFDSCVGRDTRLVVVTTGILLRRLLDDVALEDVGAVVLDEFHERTIEMDLVLGLVLRIRQTLRPDLRIVVMSATLAAEPVARLLGDCPVMHAEGRRFPVQIRYQRRGEQRPLAELVAATVPDALRETTGHVLVFLPGVGEILRAQEALAPLAERQGLALVPLFGDLPAEQQDRVLADLGQRKIILATNVAETSLTIDGVTAVIDSGQARQMHVSPATGLPRLELVPISQASAEQRAGRAGRTAPGVCWRLWDESSHRGRPAAETPEILRSDLAEPLLHCSRSASGASFPGSIRRRPRRSTNARRLLVLLGAIDADDRVTPLGEELARLPAHPRLGRLAAGRGRHGVLRETSIAAALLSERDPFRSAQHGRTGPRDYGTACERGRMWSIAWWRCRRFMRGMRFDDPDLELHPGGARNVLRAAEQLFHLADFPRAERAERPELALMQALLEAFPDRLGKLRPGTQDRALMVGGRGVRLDSSSRVRGEPLFLAIELNDAGGEARARLVSAVERDWLPDEIVRTARGTVLQSDARAGGSPRADLLGRSDARRNAGGDRRRGGRGGAAGPAGAAATRARAAGGRLGGGKVPGPRPLAGRCAAGPGTADARRGRIGSSCCRRFATACDRSTSCAAPIGSPGCRPASATIGSRKSIGSRRPSWNCPAAIGTRSCTKSARRRCSRCGFKSCSALAETPTVAGGRVPLVLHLLGPNYRPQQVTADLASFWQNGYPEVKKELRRRYPKHAWPDDPLATEATRSGLKRDMK